MVGRERAAKGTSARSAHVGLTSLGGTAAEVAGDLRGHRGVANGPHGCLDVSFREDANRTRETSAGADLGVIRRVAAALLKRDDDKGRIEAERLHAALAHKYRLRALQGFTGN